MDLKYVPQNLVKGQKVEELQGKLALLGYHCGMIDGIFGLNTDRAVREFQADNELKVDGIVEEQTANKLGMDL